MGRPRCGEALAEARAALATADVPIGAVVLDPAGAVIGRGRNRREADADPTAHAEVLALREAAAARGEWRLDGCTLVVTLEPCTMCAGASCCPGSTGWSSAPSTPKAGAVGSLWDVVRDRRLNHRPEVRQRRARRGVARALLREFFDGHRERPQEPRQPISGDGDRSGTLVGGGVSERPKEHASKACEGSRPPWVQIPPPPPAGHLREQIRRTTRTPQVRVVQSGSACRSGSPADGRCC